MFHFFLLENTACSGLRCKHLEELRELVVEKQKKGEKYSDIVKLLGIPLGTVKSIMWKHKLHGTTVTLRCSSCPRKTTVCEDKAIIQEVGKNCKIMSWKIQQMVGQDFKKNEFVNNQQESAGGGIWL